MADARETLTALPPSSALEVPLSTLFNAARDWSITHRADPVFMTDAFLVAVLQAAPNFWRTVPPFDELARRIDSSILMKSRLTLM